jgi:hypothetical protein
MTFTIYLDIYWRIKTTKVKNYKFVSLQDTGNIYTNFFLMDSTEMIAIVISLVTINKYAQSHITK